MLRSAKVVFAERGFHQATVDEIAAVAGFGKGTLYNYFEEGKQEMSIMRSTESEESVWR